MSQQLPEGAWRVQTFLVEKQSSRKVRLLPETTATAQDAAKALNVPVSHIGKSIVFRTDKGVAVVVVRGDQRVDTRALVRLMDVVSAKQMRADEVKSSTGFAIGGVSPFALPDSIKVVIDSHLQDFDYCYVAAGHPKAVVQVKPGELVVLANGIVLPISTLE